MEVTNTAAYCDTATITSVKRFQVQTPEAGLLNKSSCLAPALGLTNFLTEIDMILVTLCCAT